MAGHVEVDLEVASVRSPVRQVTPGIGPCIAVVAVVDREAGMCALGMPSMAQLRIDDLNSMQK